MRLLILGGTKFLGRAIVEAALARDHDVTLFNRGQTNPELFPDVEKLRGDRDGDLSMLTGGSWDSVIDTSGFFPRIVRASAEALAESAAHYTFVSSISVYANLAEPPVESSPVGTLEDESVEELGDEFENYGPLKALCERAAKEAFGERTLIVRPGYIVGPHDLTERFVYWPRRVARGGTMIAPAPPERPIQFIDVRDLADWIVSMAERRAAGTYNATNEGVPMRDLLAACPGEVDVAWLDDGFLVEQGMDESDLPLWSADPRFGAVHEADVAKALGARLTFRPVGETARDTLEWDRTRTDARPSGLTPEREAELLAEWASLPSGA
jgi:2'-hydroxyisoflavone reductase